MKRIESFKKALENREAVKIIAGIDNFDVAKVEMVVSAAERAGASAVDICASEGIFNAVRGLTEMPIFVSSVVPEELAQAVEYGADAIEVGNFDTLYRNGGRISAQEVLEIARRTMVLVGATSTFVSVTVPGHIEVSEQISLVRELEALGVDLIQTEGSATITPQSSGARGLLETSQVSLSNTIELVRNTELPVMSASGITPTTAALFFAAGARAIGVGSCVNKLSSTIEMVAVIRSLIEVVQTSRKAEKATV